MSAVMVVWCGTYFLEKCPLSNTTKYAGQINLAPHGHLCSCPCLSDERRLSHKITLKHQDVGRDSSVSIANRYGLDSPEIEFRRGGGGGDIFHNRPDRPWGPPSLLYNGYWVSFPGVKPPGRGANHPLPSSCRGPRKGRVIPLLHLWGPQGLL
jgi:hypothetical protein